MSSVEVYQVVVAGEEGVGKSALTVRFFEGVFIDEYKYPDEEPQYRKAVKVDGTDAVVDVMDAGREGWQAARPGYLSRAEAVLLLYDISNRASFEQLEAWRSDIAAARAGKAEAAIVLVGHKCDLDSGRQVPLSDAQSYADRHGFPLFECSSRSAANVDAVFTAMVRHLRSREATSAHDAKTNEKESCSIS